MWTPRHVALAVVVNAIVTAAVVLGVLSSQGPDSALAAMREPRAAFQVQCRHELPPLPALPLPQIQFKKEMGGMLQSMGLRGMGLELGVQRGGNAKALLEGWTSCSRMYLVDVWRQFEESEHYLDFANVDKKEQIGRMAETAENVYPHSDVAVMIRASGEVAASFVPAGSLDFVYIDARHDYLAVLEDLTLIWPLLRSGGVFAGHDYLDVDEVKARTPKQDWSKSAGGVDNGNKAVKSAVNEFAAAHGVRTAHILTTEDRFPSWYFRKP